MISVSPTTRRKRVEDTENCFAALAEIYGSQKDMIELITLILVEDHAISWKEREELLQTLSLNTGDSDEK